MISRFVYKGKNGIVKLPPEKYKKILFEGVIETHDEIKRYIDESLVGERQRVEMIKYVFQVIRSLEMVLVEPLAMMSELVYIHEFAAIIDFVI